MRITLIGCSKDKLRTPAEARDLYSSTLFKKARRYAELRLGGSWYILSGKYGLLHPDSIIEPYDVSVTGFRAAEALAWAQGVARQLACLEGLRSVEFLAGSHYTRHLKPILEARSVEVLDPMRGMGIGKRLQFLSQ